MRLFATECRAALVINSVRYTVKHCRHCGSVSRVEKLFLAPVDNREGLYTDVRCKVLSNKHCRMDGTLPGDRAGA